MQAWLQTRQRRFMRPDAARYLQPDRARFLAPERKWDGQPRIEEGEEGAGQYTFGKQDETGAPDRPATNSDGQPRVYIDRTLSPGDSEEGEGASNDLDNIFLASATKPGFGHNGGPELDGAPDIPQSMPETREQRMSFVRAAANWLFGRSAIGVSAFFGLLDQVDEIGRLSNMIRTANDPPASLEQLQRRAQEPSQPGYENHHIVNQHQYNRTKFGAARIESPQNIVRIPTLKHIELSRWYATGNPRFGGRSPQEALRHMDWEEQSQIGLEQLRSFRVLE